MTQHPTQDSQSELSLIRNVFDELNLVFPTGDIITLSEENEKAFKAYVATRVKEAEKNGVAWAIERIEADE